MTDTKQTDKEQTLSYTSDFFDEMRKTVDASGVSKEVDSVVEDAPSIASVESSRQENTQVETGMPAEARRALVNLMRHGVILASQKIKLFESLCLHQELVRRHLAEVYLKLVLDEKTGVAFIAGIQESDEESDDSTEAVSLITKRTLTLYDTLLLLVLRKHFQERETEGEQKVIIDVERIEANLMPFLPLTNSSKSDRRKLIPSLKRMLEKKIIVLLRGSKDRFEISPVIRYVVSADFLENMLAEYLKIANEHNNEANINIGKGASDYIKGSENV